MVSLSHREHALSMPIFESLRRGEQQPGAVTTDKTGSPNPHRDLYHAH